MTCSTKQNNFVFSFLFIISFFLFLLVVLPKTTFALYGDGCEQYGFMAYDAGGYCKCMYGYVFDTDFLGNKTCKSADLVCSDKYGTFSRYNTLSNSCECSYGYVFANQYGETKCVSRDSLCKNQLGYSARYSTLSNSCECGYGDVIIGGRCTNGDSVCRSRHGLYSSYNSTDNKCECDSGYTLDKENQCVKKQNNVYFRLLDVDTENNRAIIKSEYDFSKYLVEYGIGCYSFSIQRYLYKQIVVNLGTDFDVDRWDKIVLQDDDEVCSILDVERTFDDSLEETEEEDSISTYYYLPPANTEKNLIPPQSTKNTQPKPITIIQNNDFEVSTSDVSSINKVAKINTSASFRKCPSTQCSLIRYYAEGSSLEVVGEYKKGEWYQVKGTTDAGGSGKQVTGWIYKPLLDVKEKNATTTIEENEQTTNQEVTELESSFLDRIWRKLSGWFK